MSENNLKKTEARTSSILPVESIRVIAEAVGIGGLQDEVAAFIADDVSYRLKVLSQEAGKFAWHGKRSQTNAADFESALKARNVEPLYGFVKNDSMQYRPVTVGGKEICAVEDKEVDLQTIINSQLPKVPPEVGLKVHWLAIDGQQPAIPDNPPPAASDILKTEASADARNKKQPKTSPVKAKFKMKVPEKVHVKDLVVHELSLEQQLYYKEITEACVGSDEGKRSEALQSLSVDPGLHQLLPRFSLFICEGVKVNVVQNNLALLIYLMRMVKSLMDNPSLSLEKYLHELIPATMTCIVSRQLCLRPDVDNHWALRDFSARLLAQITKVFNTTTNNIQARLTKIFTDILEKEKSLAIHYGAITGLAEMGPEIVRTILWPFVKAEGEKMVAALEGHPSNIAEKNAADHIKQSLVKCLSTVIRPLPMETVEEFVSEFGTHVGIPLHSQVTKMRQTPAVVTTAATSLLRPAAAASAVSSVLQRPLVVQALPTTPRAVFSPRFPTTPSFGDAHRNFVLTPPAGAQRSASSVLLSQAPSSAATQQSVAVRVLPSTPAAAPGAPPQKYVVLSMGSTSQQNPPSDSSNTGFQN